MNNNIKKEGIDDMMKKLGIIVLTLVFVLTTILVGCSKKNTAESTVSEETTNGNQVSMDDANKDKEGRTEELVANENTNNQEVEESTEETSEEIVDNENNDDSVALNTDTTTTQDEKEEAEDKTTSSNTSPNTTVSSSSKTTTTSNSTKTSSSTKVSKAISSKSNSNKSSTSNTSSSTSKNTSNNSQNNTSKQNTTAKNDTVKNDTSKTNTNANNQNNNNTAINNQSNETTTQNGNSGQNNTNDNASSQEEPNEGEEVSLWVTKVDLTKLSKEMLFKLLDTEFEGEYMFNSGWEKRMPYELMYRYWGLKYGANISGFTRKSATVLDSVTVQCIYEIQLQDGQIKQHKVTLQEDDNAFWTVIEDELLN